MKTYPLLAPDFSSLDTIWRHPLPFVLWPVGQQRLIDHWTDEAIRQGAQEIHVYAADRPAEIRQHLNVAGGYWGRKAKVIAMREDTDAPADAIRMDRLPQQEGIKAPFAQPQELLSHWLGMQRFWLTHRGSGKVTLDVEIVPGGWVGPHARVHPRAHLRPPFWIGARAEIAAGCQVGPHALVGEGSVLDANAQIEDAVTLPETYVGRNTSLQHAIAQGGILVDVRRPCRVDVSEDFILGNLVRPRASATLAGKLAASALWLLLAPPAKFWPGQTWTQKEILTCRGRSIQLGSGSRGPLLFRRWPWLGHIASGNLCWFGILPRGRAEWTRLPAETAERLRSSPQGVFSWADLQGCHDVSAPEEWVHAAYQVLQRDAEVTRILRRQAWRLAFRRPDP